MDNNVTILQKLKRFRFILLGIFFGVLYWLIETCVHVFWLNEGSFIEQMFFPEFHEMWMRSLMGVIILIFSVFVQFLVNKREITERELIESEEKWRSLVENAPNIIMTLDQNGKILFINHTVPGLSVDDVVGSNVREYTQPEHIETLMTAIEEVFRTGKSTTYEISGTGPQGSVAYYSTRIGPIKEEGKIVAAIQIITDITERKRAEEEVKRSNKELEEFAYVASHDLQEPLRMVVSYLQLLERRYGVNLDSDAKEFINYAVDGASWMQILINDLLKYSKVGTKGKELKPTNSKEVFEQTLTNIQMSIEENGAMVTYSELPMVMADETQLGQLFQNLVGNAIKFHGEEPPCIHVSAQENGTEWIFSVEDNGIGIDPEYKERIFTIFQRLHARNDYPGTGIGLSVCKKIVERHGGSIWVDSKPGDGSTFYFTFKKTKGEET